LLEAIIGRAFDTFVDNQVDAAVRPADEDLARFRRWFERLYSRPNSLAEDAWVPPTWYQFASSAPPP
jgi:hypothetical protein